MNGADAAKTAEPQEMMVETPEDQLEVINTFWPCT